MKVFVCCILLAFALIAAANPAAVSSNVNVNQEAEGEVQVQPIQPVVDLTRLRKSAGYGGGAAAGGYGGGGTSMAALPCPKNYLFSCQPNLSPVPCSAGSSSSYGSQGAYSAPVHTYVAPVRPNYGIPQSYTGPYVPQPFGYNTNQYYQY